MTRHPLQIVRIAGLFACLNSALVVLSLEFYSARNPIRRNIVEAMLAGRVPVWATAIIEIIGYVIYGCVLWRVTRPEEVRSPRNRTLLLIAIQVVLTLLLVSLDIFYIVAAEVGLLFTLRIGAFWLVGQAVIETAMFFHYPNQLYWLYPPEVAKMPRLLGVAIVGAWSLTYYFLAYSFGRLGAREERQRTELSALQQIEAESVRLADRLAIARELHDSIGHHLSALSVNLQLASRLATGNGAKPVADAYQLAQELLRDVRDVVSDLRSIDAAQLARALKTIGASVPTPTIHVDVDEEFVTIEPVASHVLFRCAQETITNAIRHSEARNLWINLRTYTWGYELLARDDGKGTSNLRWGNGLTGLRERIQDVGGEVSIETDHGHGFSLLIRIPRREKVMA